MGDKRKANGEGEAENKKSKAAVAGEEGSAGAGGAAGGGGEVMGGPSGFKVLKEGAAEILVQGNDVFYNKAQVVNRDLSVCVLRAFVAVRREEENQRAAAAAAGVKGRALLKHPNADLAAKSAAAAAAKLRGGEKGGAAESGEGGEKGEAGDGKGEDKEVKEREGRAAEGAAGGEGGEGKETSGEKGDGATATDAAAEAGEGQQQQQQQAKVAEVKPLRILEPPLSFVTRPPHFEPSPTLQLVSLPTLTPPSRGLAASGLRSIRYAKEIPGVGAVVALDNDPVAVQACQRNVALILRLRSIRYAKEIPGVGAVVALDNDPVAVQACQRNVAHNFGGAPPPATATDAAPPPPATAGGAAVAEGEGGEGKEEGKGGDKPASEGGKGEGERAVPVRAEQGDARVYMILHEKQFDAVDLDPYGTPSVFLDGAVQAVADGGMLLVTATDMAVLCGNNAEVCYSKYGAYPHRAKYCHEMAIRILLASIESAANRFKRHIVPVLSVSVDFYIRVFVRVFTSAQAVKVTPSKLAHVFQCSGCDSYHLQPVGRVVEGRAKTTSPHANCVVDILDNSFFFLIRLNPPLSSLFLPPYPPALQKPDAPPPPPRYLPGLGPVIPPACEHCGRHLSIGGPMWSAPIHDASWVRLVLGEVQAGKGRLAGFGKVHGLLTAVSEELHDIPLYLDLHEISATLKCTPFSPFVLPLLSLSPLSLPLPPPQELHDIPLYLDLHEMSATLKCTPFSPFVLPLLSLSPLSLPLPPPQELHDIPLYLDLHEMSATLKCCCSAPRWSMQGTACRGRTPTHSASRPTPRWGSSGMSCAGTACSGRTPSNSLGIKTDAPLGLIWDVMLCWIRDHPVKSQGEGSPADTILAKPPTTEVNFAKAPKALSKAQQKGVARFVPNPEAYWGPKPRAGRKDATAMAVLAREEGAVGKEQAGQADGKGDEMAE
ncbi:unnamed protein product [Closterium sp. Naga37s-1]|nr:unnamed protein product [Closterium sp. Naga37s-1]